MNDSWRNWLTQLSKKDLKLEQKWLLETIDEYKSQLRDVSKEIGKRKKK